MSAIASSTARPRRLRAAAPHGLRGASSVLRLARAGSALPSTAALSGWAARAGSLIPSR
jgi:hypothetical protein